MRLLAVSTTLAALLLCGAVASCGAEEELTGSIARTAAAQAGKIAFKEAGHEIDGRLTCSDKQLGGMEMNVTCTGITRDGQPAELTAELRDNSEVATGDRVRVKGARILGTVGGQEVFNKSCIGRGC